MHRFKEKYQREVAPAMRERFKYPNALAVPRITKVVINVGTSQGLKDAKYNELVERTLERITGQKPVKTIAKQSISNFKIRKGLVVGMMVTLRGNRMFDFLDKLVNITLPRVRDFRGLDEKTVDRQGNINLGFKENIAFPEIDPDEIERLHGLQVTVVTTATTREEGLTLFKLLGFPFFKS